MPSKTGKFTYQILAPEKQDLPSNAIVNITLRSYSSREDGWPLISPNLMSEGEIDWYIESYKEDLDRVGRVAKRALNRANARTLKWTRARHPPRPS